MPPKSASPSFPSLAQAALPTPDLETLWILYSLLGEHRLRQQAPQAQPLGREARSNIAGAVAELLTMPPSPPMSPPPPSVPPGTQLGSVRAVAAEAPAQPEQKPSAPATLPSPPSARPAQRTLPSRIELPSFDPEDQFLCALLKEMRLIASDEHQLLNCINLSRIHFADIDSKLAVVCNDHQTVINRRHSAVKRALALGPDEPAGLWFVIAAVYTALNIFFLEVRDDDESQFLSLLCKRAASRSKRSAAPLVQEADL